MYMVEISEDKFEGLYDHFEKGFKYLGKAMGCLEEMKEHKLGHRGSYGMRDEDWEDEDFGERRGRKMGMRGSYSRY